MKSKYAVYWKDYWIYVIVFLVVFKLYIILTTFHLIGWDEAVYLGMGKYIYSGGAIGLFEEIRPLGLPQTVDSLLSDTVQSLKSL